MQSKGLLTKLAETIDAHRLELQHQPRGNNPAEANLRASHRWLPTPGNVLFTLIIIFGLIGLQNSGAITLFAAPNMAAISTSTIAYQGRLANSAGAPLTQTVNMSFRLYSSSSGGASLWEEQWSGANSVRVSDGLFNVMLGSVNPIPQAVITGNSNLFLGITVGTDSEMTPRVQLGSVPFATQALTVPDRSITKAKLATDIQLGLTEVSGTYTAQLSVYEGTSPAISPATIQLRYRRIGSVVFVSMPLFSATITGSPTVLNMSLPFPPAVSDEGANGGITTNGGTFSAIEGVMSVTSISFRKPSGGFLSGQFRGGFWYVASN